MTRLKTLILAVAAMATLLVSSGASEAAAACDTPCPYTGCISTNSTLRAPDVIKRGTRPVVKVRVTPRSGNVTVRGAIKVVVRKNDRTKSTAWISYRGNSFKAVKGPRLGTKGTWTAVARFRSDFKFPCSTSNTESIRVVRRLP